MIRIALVGEIGSGKTFVSKCFNYPVFNADEEVKRIYKNNRKCFRKLKEKFPKNIKKFPIQKSELKKIINKKNIKILSRVIHPYVRDGLNKFLTKNRKKKYVILDIPLFIENNLNLKSDILIFIKISNKIINKRLKKRGNYNEKIMKIIKSEQLNKNKKRKYCNFVIENNYDKNNIIKQIKKIKKKFND